MYFYSVIFNLTMKTGRDHGFPLRVIVPGVVAARSVKWLNRIHLSSEESSSHWQQRDYKIFPPSVQLKDTPLQWDKQKSMQQMPVQSAICVPDAGELVSEGEEVRLFNHIELSLYYRLLLRDMRIAEVGAI